MKPKTFRKRIFLNEISTSLTSYIYVEAEPSENGKYRHGNYFLRIADCEGSVFFEFGLGSKFRRGLSLKKLDRLVNTLTEFRVQLRKEASLIDAYRPPPKTKKRS